MRHRFDNNDDDDLEILEKIAAAAACVWLGVWLALVVGAAILVWRAVA